MQQAAIYEEGRELKQDYHKSWRALPDEYWDYIHRDTMSGYLRLDYITYWHLLLVNVSHLDTGQIGIQHAT